MIPILTILILLACFILAFVILIQNPKGGGLSGTFGSMSSQVMGVKQSTDIMEKSTWIMVGTIGLLCIISVYFFQKPAGFDKNGNEVQQRSAPAKGK